MKILSKKLNCFLVLMFLAFCLFPSALLAAGVRTVRIGYMKIPTFQEQNVNGVRYGYGYEFLQLLSRYNQWSYDYVGYDQGSADLYDLLQRGQLDMVIFAVKSDARQKMLDFSQERVGSSTAVLVTPKSNKKYDTTDYTKYAGMRIGVVKNNPANASLESFAKDKKFTYKTVVYDSVAKLNNAMTAGNEIDAILTLSIQDLHPYKELLRFSPVPYYIAVKKGNTELLAEVNSSMKQLLANKPDFMQQLSTKYYQRGSAVELAYSAAEQAYIAKLKKEGRKIKALMRPDLSPLSSFDEKGVPQGSFLTLVREMEKRTGLAFEIIATKTWDEYEKKSQDKEVALLVDSVMHYSAAEKAGFKLTDAYAHLPAALLALNDNSKRESIALVTGDRAGSHYAHSKFKPEKIHMVNTPQEAIEAVLSGKADVCFSNLYSANELAAADEKHRLHVDMVMGIEIPCAFAVKNSQDKELLAILNKAVASLGRDYVRSLLSVTKPLQTKISLADYLHSDKSFAIGLGLVLVLLVFFAGFSVYGWRSAKKQRCIRKEWETLLSRFCLTFTKVEVLNVDDNLLVRYILTDEGIEIEESELPSIKQFLASLHPDDAERAIQLDLQMILERVMKTCGQYELEVRESTGDGNYRWTSYLLQGVRSSAQHHRRICLVLKRDVDDAKNREFESREQMQKALVAARQTAEAKGRFMSKMSQEVRIPLNAIISYLDLMKEEKKPEELQSFIEKADVSAKQLLGFVNDVVDISAIENGKLELNETLFDFKQTIAVIARLFYDKAAQKGVRFEIVMENLAEGFVIGDRVRLNQILVNILSNAIKFTPAGNSVTCLVKQQEIKNKKVYMHFEITDTGKGMSEDFLQKIFTPFEQESNVVTGNYGGTGLGMSITYNLVNMLKGAISVESTPNVGSTFKVDLPFGYDAQQHSQTGETPDFSFVKALIVDDQNNSAVYIAGLFEAFGVVCDIANSGSQALEKLTAAKAAGQTYKLCLLDWHMPEMDGMVTYEKIKALELKELKTFIVTGYDYTEIAEKAKNAGVIALLNKPLFRSKVSDLLIDAFGAEIEEGEGASSFNFEGKRVLVVEDNDISADITLRLLRKVNIKPERVASGREACEKFDAASAGYYGAILMGIQLPEIDGYEVARLIRMSDHPEGQTIPIVAMADTVFAEDVAKALDSGMNAHIGKPIDKQELYSTLKNYMD